MPACTALTGEPAVGADVDAVAVDHRAEPARRLAPEAGLDAAGHRPASWSRPAGRPPPAMATDETPRSAVSSAIDCSSRSRAAASSRTSWAFRSRRSRTSASRRCWIAGGLGERRLLAGEALRQHVERVALALEAVGVGRARRAQLREVLEPLAIAARQDRDDARGPIEGPRVVEREEQAVVAERHQLVERGPGAPGPRASAPRARRRRRRRARQRGVDGRGRHGPRPRRLLAFELAGLDAPARSGAGGSSSVRCSPARRAASALAWASRASRTLGEAGAAARAARRSPTAAASAAGRTAGGSSRRSRELPPARRPDVACLPTIVCILADSRHDECRPVRSCARPGYRPEAHRPCAQRPDAAPWRRRRRDHRAAAARRGRCERRTSSPRRRTGWSAIVVGRPLHLDGRASAETARRRRVRRAAADPDGAAGVRPGRAAVQRRGREPAGVGERDWRQRKPRLDAAAAAVILQDFLDQARPVAGAARSPSADAHAASGCSCSRSSSRRSARSPLRSLDQPYQGYTEPEIFVDIPHGLGVSAIGHRLVEAGVIKSDWAFRLAVWRRGAARTLKAGEYRFTGAMRASDVVDRLVAGSVFLRPVTFPEGLTIAEMAAVFETAGLGTEGDVHGGGAARLAGARGRLRPRTISRATCSPRPTTCRATPAPRCWSSRCRGASSRSTTPRCATRPGRAG